MAQAPEPICWRTCFAEPTVVRLLSLQSVGGNLYFAATSGDVTDRELWKSNGTAWGTSRVRDIHVGDDGSSPCSLIDLNGTLYFAAESLAEGRELWKSDGTFAGTQLVKDINPGAASGMAYVYEFHEDEIAVFQNKLWFPGETASEGIELWSSDGTTAGTNLAKDINIFALDSEPEDFTVAGTKLYFTAENIFQGRELWATDGTVSGTVLIEDINPGAASSEPRDLMASAGILYFSAETNTHGRELWRSLGSSQNTYQIIDLRPGVDGSFPRPLAYMGGKTYFAANNGIQGMELYATTGGSQTTLMVRDLYLGSGYGVDWAVKPIIFQNKLFYRGATATTGLELAVSDGTISGTQILKDIKPQHEGHLEEENFYLTPHGSSVFFVSNIPNEGRVLCTSDGTASGTKMVKNLSPNSFGFYPRNLFSHQAELFFSGDNGSDGLELWKTTGSNASTVQVADIVPGQSGSSPDLYCSFNGDLYFTGESGCCGNALMKYDGNAVSVVKSNLGFFISYVGGRPTTILEHQNIMYFSAGDNVIKDELWRSDGTTLGTWLVKDINPGADRSGVRSLTSLGNDIYFTADDGTHGRELWKTDGTSQGTVMINDLEAGPESSNPEELIVMNGNLYFRATTANNGSELFRYNPSINSLTLVKEIGFSHNSSFPTDMVVYNNALFFTANDGIHGQEVWKTYGTSNSTQLLKDIYPGIGGSAIDNIVAAGGYLFFAASDSVHGHELWYSDGTPGNTGLYQDLYPGITSSSPRALTLAGGNLFMFAYDSLAGNEIHMISLRGISLPVEGLELAASYENDMVKLNWATEREINSDYFEVQRSIDGSLFGPIGMVSAAGQSNAIQHYTYPDRELFTETVYYRLKVVDVDGSFSFSNTVAVSPLKIATLDWRVAGNPVVNHKLKLEGSALQESMQVMMYDTQGKLIMRHAIEPGTGETTLDIPGSTSSGVYILNMHTSQKQLSKRLFVE